MGGGMAQSELSLLRGQAGEGMTAMGKAAFAPQDSVLPVSPEDTRKLFPTQPLPLPQERVRPMRVPSESQ